MKIKFQIIIILLLSFNFKMHSNDTIKLGAKTYTLGNPVSDTNKASNNSIKTYTLGKPNKSASTWEQLKESTMYLYHNNKWAFIGGCILLIGFVYRVLKFLFKS